jgi:DNA helicase-2/ATP-dependent DNA helicase PcrA
MKLAKYLTELNERQREAVEQTDGPLLVLAGAGSGKTRVITHRIAHLIASGKAKSSEILAVTFTNKAAGEMKSRVVDLLGPEGRWVYMSTFHSFCARVLRDNCEVLGYKRGYSIYDDSESTALIKRIYKDNGIPENQPSHGVTRHRISRAKDELITSEEFEKTADDFLDTNVAKAYKAYQTRLLKNQAMDFDDLLMNTVILFKENRYILKQFQNRFKYIMIDEYQDTNHSQYTLVNLLADCHKNLCVVGDDDQSIYGWRGADIRNILDFENEYPDAKTIKLEQNYRSTQSILDAAGDVVNRIHGRKAKRLFTENGTGENITVMMCGDEVDEADAVTEKIKSGLTLDKSASDFAVLYRTNAQSRVLEDSLRHKGLPYTIVGGIRFYERAEVKDILAYLRLLVNPDDGLALNRIINVPKRGVGKTSVQKIETYSSEKNVSMISAILNSLDETGVSGKAKTELVKFAKIMTDLTSKINDLSPQDIAARLINDIKYIDMLDAVGTPEADVKADNVKELVAGIAEYTERNENATLAGFLEEVALITDIDRWDDSAQAVTLMTLHAAKGLEFDTVFLAGMEDGLFPLQRGFGNDENPDEERRLCYVGMTRAKKKLFLSMAGFRRRWGDYTGGPSEFLKDIPEKLIDVERYNYWNGYGANSGNSHNKRTKTKRPKKTQTVIDYDNIDTDSILPIGTRVMHHKFGYGTVTKREGSGEEMMVTIKFNTVGSKQLMVKYASLEILGQ